MFFYDCGVFKLLKLEEESWSSLIVLSSAAWFDYTCFHIKFSVEPFFSNLLHLIINKNFLFTDFPMLVLMRGVERGTQPDHELKFV